MPTAAENARYYQKHKERLKKKLAEWKSANKDKCLSYGRAWNEKNKEARSASFKAWRLTNKGTRNAAIAAYRATKRKATPKWTCLQAIRDIYEKAVSMKLHVDHIVPINNNLVCGLHVPANLQLLPGLTNQSKGNRTWPDMP